MDMEISLFTKPEELLEWVEKHNNSVGMDLDGAAILMEYLEGHDYAIGVNANEELVRKDIAEEGGEIELYSIDDLIDCVCEWNYELILEADMRRNNPCDFIDFSNEQSRYDKYKRDEAVLDAMFDRTTHGKKCEELGRMLAEAFVERLNHSSDMEKEATTIAKEIKSYSTGNRGR